MLSHELQDPITAPKLQTPTTESLGEWQQLTFSVCLFLTKRSFRAFSSTSTGRGASC